MEKNLLFALGLPVLLSMLIMGCPGGSLPDDDDDTGNNGTTDITMDLVFVCLDGSALVELSIAVPDSSKQANTQKTRAAAPQIGAGEYAYSIKRNNVEISKGIVSLNIQGNAGFTSIANKKWNGKIGVDGKIEFSGSTIPLDDNSSLDIGGFFRQLPGEEVLTADLNGMWRGISTGWRFTGSSYTRERILLGVTSESGSFSRTQNTITFTRPGNSYTRDLLLTSNILLLGRDSPNERGDMYDPFYKEEPETELEGTWYNSDYHLRIYMNCFTIWEIGGEPVVYSGFYNLDSGEITFHADNGKRWVQPYTLSGTSLSLGAGYYPIDSSTVPARALAEFVPEKSFAGTWENLVNNDGVSLVFAYTDEPPAGKGDFTRSAVPSRGVPALEGTFEVVDEKNIKLSWDPVLEYPGATITVRYAFRTFVGNDFVPPGSPPQEGLQIEFANYYADYHKMP